MRTSLQTTLLIALVVALVAGDNPVSAAKRQGFNRGNATRSASGRKSSRTRFGGNHGNTAQRRVSNVQGFAKRGKSNFAPHGRKLTQPKRSINPDRLSNLRDKLQNHGRRIGPKNGVDKRQHLSVFPKHHGKHPRKLNHHRFQQVFRHHALIGQTAGYRKALTYSHRLHWHRRQHCGWWSHLAINCYYNSHRTYCPNYYWDQCHRYRYVYVACPATPVYAPSYWYFGCEVVYIPEVGYGIESITPNSPAALAGLKQGDMIVQIEGQTPADDGALANAVQSTGGQLDLAVLRQGSTQPEGLEVALQPIQKSGL